MRNAEIGQHDRIKNCVTDHQVSAAPQNGPPTNGVRAGPYCIAAYGFRQRFSIRARTCPPHLWSRGRCATIALRALAYDAAA
jgi:hypothetical protein